MSLWHPLGREEEEGGGSAPQGCATQSTNQIEREDRRARAARADPVPPQTQAVAVNPLIPWARRPLLSAPTPSCACSAVGPSPRPPPSAMESPPSTVSPPAPGLLVRGAGSAPPV